MQLPAVVANGVGRLAYEFSRLQPFIPMYIHLITSAIFPIYTGAHSSLTRPTSAAKRDKSRNKNKDDLDDSEDEDEDPQRMEGLSPGDAVMFPILAACTLAGLYFLIKWLQDPSILNKILNWYFATFSVVLISRLVCDGLNVIHSLVFPRDYLDQGVLYRVKPRAKMAIPSTPSAATRSSPLPSLFSRLPVPQYLNDLLWALYVMPSRKLQFKAYIRHSLDLNINLGVHRLVGLVIGLSTVLWYNFVSKPWFLTNAMGFGFAYGTLQILSPTTFSTGSLILCGLFFYDIYFVFYTPMMVTVATSLDIPVKLLFPRPPDAEAEPGRRPDPARPPMSMLGLGDIVLPGIMIGLALRFDLYMFYLKKQTKSSNSLKQQTSSPRTRSSSRKRSHPPSPTSPTAPQSADVIKAPYISVAESWGDRLWTSSLLTGSRQSPSTASRYIARNAFPKPYFHASLMGYIGGMMTTLGAMQISGNAQPALLYLVPSVLTTLWTTAWFRGEIKEMWVFSDASDEDEEDETKRKNKKNKQDIKADSEKASEQASKESSENVGDNKSEEQPVAERTRSHRKSIFSSERSESRVKRIRDAVSKGTKNADTNDKEREDKAREGKWFSFSIKLPSFSLTESGSKKERAGGSSSSLFDDGGSHRYSLRSTGRSDEHADKRRRVD